MKYDEELQLLSGQVGGRNRRLLGLALKGRLAGRDAETMVDEIVAASGTPPLSAAEVRRAVEKAMKLPISERPRPMPRRPKYTPSPTPTPTSYSFVREMIATGGGEASSADLIALSPIDVPELPWVQSIHFLIMLEEADSGLFFTGSPKMRRTRERLSDLCGLQVNIIDNPEALPTHILPNDLTGEAVRTEGGEESYAREQCVRHARYAVIEFDEMPLKEQAAFWKGVILTKSAEGKCVLPLRALVYSGGKSIHGLLRLDDTKDFKAQWRILERTLASDADARYRCDLAFRSPVQMMRFPGAIRPETHRRQALLYLAD